MPEILLKDITHSRATQDTICEWNFIDVENFYARVYYKAHEKEGMGFLFLAVEVVSNIFDDIWNIEHTEVNEIFEGIAFFDRTAHMNTGDNGYISCPDLDLLIATLTVIRELEKKYCRDWD